MSGLVAAGEGLNEIAETIGSARKDEVIAVNIARDELTVTVKREAIVDYVLARADRDSH